MSDERCGTTTGYKRHQRRGEKPCQPCTVAKAEYDERWRSAPERTRLNRLHARSQNRALLRLSKIYPDIYRALYAEERERALREAGLPVTVVGLNGRRA